MAGNANIVARLVARARLHPDRVAIADRAQRLTFSELADRTGRVAARLRASGVAPGDHVLVFVPMSVELYATLLGTLRMGAAAVFVDAWADRRRLAAAVAAAAPAAFVGTPRAHLLRLVSGAVRRIPRAFTPAGLFRGRTVDSPVEAVGGDAPALMTFTTGTTGTPKAAVRSHRFLVAQHEALMAHLQLGPTDIDMPTLPVFVLNNLAGGVTSIIPDADPRRPADIDPHRVFKQMVRESVTTSSGSPAFYERLAAWCERERRQLPLRAVFTGGAPVLPPLARRLRDAVTGSAHVVYGSTEAEPIAGITADEMVQLAGTADGVCVGQPVAHIRLKLIQPHDEPIVLGAGGWSEWEVAAGEAGEVVVAGAHVLAGYANDEESDRRNKVRDGSVTWHRTGDAARRDDEGRVWLLGRVRERVVRDGVTWWPLPAEVRALAVPGVTHAAYVGVAGGARETEAVLCVECPAGDRSGIEAAVRDAIAPWPVDRVHVMKRIPRDPRHASKTDLEGLRRLLGG